MVEVRHAATPPPLAVKMIVTLNRWIAYALLAIGSVLIAFGIYMGLFAWANDGLAAGFGVFGVSAAFGVALVVTGFAFRFVAASHAKREPRRWWLQLAAIVGGYGAFGLAAWASSLLD